MLKALRAGAAITAGLAMVGGLASPASASPAGRHGFGSGAGRQIVAELRSAWQITQGRGVTIAVIAGGVDGRAAGLSGKVTKGPSFGSAGGDSAVAGTVFASAVAATGPSPASPFGTLGLAPAARILSLRIPLNGTVGAGERAAGKAIRYAAARGAQVIFVMALAPDQTLALDSAVQYAVERGAVVVGYEDRSGANGNGPEYPDSLPGVIDAGWAALPGLPPPLRQYSAPVNNSILVTAPANALTASGPAGQSYVIFGSLAAAAWLTATAALIKSVYPGLPAAGVERAIAVAARDHPRGGYRPTVGFGLLNPLGALRAAQAAEKLRASAPPGAGVAAPGARLLSGPPPGPIHAVHHAPAVLAADAGAMALGLALLAAAVLPLRRRRAAKPAAPLATAPGPR